jgi:hypothetical protein
MDFKDEITKAKPNISAGSLKTYNSLLRTIYKAVIKSVDKPNVKMFSKHADDILKFLEAKPFGVRKTYLAALVAVAPLEEYKKMMLSDIRDYQHEQSKSRAYKPSLRIQLYPRKRLMRLPISYARMLKPFSRRKPIESLI